MRTRARVDANHASIAKALRGCGMSVQSLASVGKGVPDLLIGFHGVNVLLEVKDGAKSRSQRKLTPAESVWASLWSGQVHMVTSAEQAIEVVLNEVRKATM
jgi:hypothetical protein